MISVVLHGDKRRAHRRTDAVAREPSFATPPSPPAGLGVAADAALGSESLARRRLLESAAPPASDAAGLRLETGTVRGRADPVPEPGPPPWPRQAGPRRRRPPDQLSAAPRLSS